MLAKACCSLKELEMKVGGCVQFPHSLFRLWTFAVYDTFLSGSVHNVHNYKVSSMNKHREKVLYRTVIPPTPNTLASQQQEYVYSTKYSLLL